MNVLFFGDSICNGQGIALHKGWVPRLSAGLSELAEGLNKPLVVINSAVNGRTTRQALETMPYEVQSIGPEVMIIQFGMNDCNVWQSDRGNPRVSPLAFEANLREIIERTVTFGAKAIFLHTNHPTTRDHTSMNGTTVTYEAQNRKYNDIIRRIAASSHPCVRINDIAAAFESESTENRLKPQACVLGDGLHLSEAGHDLYLRIVQPRLLDCIRELLQA